MRSNAVRETARPAPVKPMDFQTLLGRLGDKDRGNLQRRMAAYEAKSGPVPAERWRRLACLLMTLAPFPARNPSRFCGVTGMQFFIPDGKYRMQAFALQGLDDGTLAVYAPDVREKAVRAGILAKPKRTDPASTHALAGAAQTLEIDGFDGKTPDPDPIYKDMTGWNRKAIRMTLPPHATNAQIEAVERICMLAAEEWPAAQPPA